MVVHTNQVCVTRNHKDGFSFIWKLAGLSDCLFKFFLHPLGSFYSQPIKKWVKGSSGTWSQWQHNKSWTAVVVLKFGRKAFAPAYLGTNSKCRVQGRTCSRVLYKLSPFRWGNLTYLSARQHPLTFRLQPLWAQVTLSKIVPKLFWSYLASGLQRIQSRSTERGK